MSGQIVNYHKSSVCFSRNTSEAVRYEVAAVLDVVQASNFGKYLGLPSFIGREKRAVFSYIEDRIKHRIGSWSKKLISQAGKEVLLKSVAQSMPTFSMSVFLLPDSVCTSIERAMNRYWWKTGSDSDIHWKAWDRLCIPKKYGGLGFKDLRAFNLAMLGKQAWRFLTRPHSLVARIYKARYYPKTSFIDATMGTNPSFCWRSIMAAHEMICTGVRRRVGDGKSTLIWGHPWLPDDPDPMVHTVMPPHLSGALVSGLIDPATGTWDHAIVYDIFLQSEAQRILRLPISSQYEDSWYWKGNPGGNYTVKDGYRYFMGEFDHTPGVFDKWLHLWKIKCPAKWRTFLWRALTNTLPTTTNLIIKRVEVDPACPMCGRMHENTMHSLVLCEYSSLVWNESQLHVPSVIGHDFGAWFDGVINVLTQDNIVFVIAVLYHLWKARNLAVWERNLPRPATVWRKAQAAAMAWGQIHATHAQPQQHEPVLPYLCSASPRCYVDAGFRPQLNTATVGAVLLTHDGSFVAAFNDHLPPCSSPLMAESLACKEALSWLKGRGLDTVQVYTDCSTLKNLLSSSSPSLFSYVRYSIDAARAIMSSFSNCSVNFVPRSANKGAHVLATLAFSQNTALFWDSVPPDSTSELI